MTAILTALLMALAGGQEAKPRKIVLLAGPLENQPKDSYEHEKSVILLKHCLMTSPSLRNVRVEAHFNGWPADPSTLDDADTILVSSGSGPTPDQQTVLDRQLARGCGLVRISRLVEGLEIRELKFTIKMPEHPVARGLQPFTLLEEFGVQQGPGQQAVLLAGEGAVGVAVERPDGGRGFSFSGGRFHASWWNADFRKLVLNALAWTARIEVPPGGVESTLEGPIRVRILTGHHYPAHEWKITTPPFISVVEQDPRVRVDVTEDLDDLTRLDQHQVLVINYMNWGKPGLSDEQKQGLVRFLERGGGLVVFHGATGTWNASLCPKESHWPEYRDKITGRWWETGSRHDNFGPFRVDNVAPDHEITRGLAAFDTKDELYLDLGGTVGVPLVAAHSKLAGRQEPLAWAHAYGKGRVFVTALGHGVVSIRSAGALFRRATVWAASAPPLSFDPPAEQTAKEPVRPGTWAPKAKPRD